MKYFLILVTVFSLAHARLGETRDELVVRLGRVTLESAHSVIAQGKISPLGPTLFFKKDEWRIQCNMVAGRCVAEFYSKTGDWTPEQIRILLENNTQGKMWGETKDSVKMNRKWKRSDGGTAEWNFTGVMQFVSSDYRRAKAAREAELKAKAVAKPNL